MASLLVQTLPLTYPPLHSVQFNTLGLDKQQCYHLQNCASLPPTHLSPACASYAMASLNGLSNLNIHHMMSAASTSACRLSTGQSPRSASGTFFSPYIVPCTRRSHTSIGGAWPCRRRSRLRGLIREDAGVCLPWLSWRRAKEWRGLISSWTGLCSGAWSERLGGMGMMNGRW